MQGDRGVKSAQGRGMGQRAPVELRELEGGAAACIRHARCWCGYQTWTRNLAVPRKERREARRRSAQTGHLRTIQTPFHLHRSRPSPAMVSGSLVPSVSGSVKMRPPATRLATPKMTNGSAPLPRLAPSSTMKGAAMPPTRAAWFSAPSTALRTYRWEGRWGPGR